MEYVTILLTFAFAAAVAAALLFIPSLLAPRRLTPVKVQPFECGVDPLEVSEGRFGLSRLEEASEMSAWSTIREVQPVVKVGDRSLPPGPITARLAQALQDRVRDGKPTS